MNIAVIGLGIIGGSFCKAIKYEGAIDEIGTPEGLDKADVIVLCMYPQACVDYIRENGKYIRKGAIVTDSSGIKRAICPQLKALSEEYGFVFVGSHPMAATAPSTRARASSSHPAVRTTRASELSRNSRSRLASAE